MDMGYYRWHWTSINELNLCKPKLSLLWVSVFTSWGHGPIILIDGMIGFCLIAHANLYDVIANPNILKGFRSENDIGPAFVWL